jgi:hypothetical protein
MYWWPSTSLQWIEYKPITKISADRVVSFICDILCGFGFPNTIIIDLGSNFHSHEFWELCKNSAIKVNYVFRLLNCGPMARLSALMA